MADIDHETSEYALVVVDRWHGRGLGGTLTDYCLDVAKRWCVRRVVAEVADDNPRLLAIFRNRGFEATGEQVAGATWLQKTL
jgi:acetyltransferase